MSTENRLLNLLAGHSHLGIRSAAKPKAVDKPAEVTDSPKDATSASTEKSTEKKKPAPFLLFKGEQEAALRQAIEEILRDPNLSEIAKHEKIRVTTADAKDQAIMMTIANVVSQFPSIGAVGVAAALGASASGRIPEMMEYIRRNLPPEMVAKAEKVANLELERITLQVQHKINDERGNIPPHVHEQIDHARRENSGDMEKACGQQIASLGNSPEAEKQRAHFALGQRVELENEKHLAHAIDTNEIRKNTHKLFEIAEKTNAPQVKEHLQQCAEIDARLAQIEREKARTIEGLVKAGKTCLPEATPEEHQRIAAKAGERIFTRIGSEGHADLACCRQALCEEARTELHLTEAQFQELLVRSEPVLQKEVMAVVGELETSVKELRILLDAFYETYFSIVLFVLNLIVEEENKRLARAREDDEKRARVEQDEIKRQQNQQILAAQERNRSLRKVTEKVVVENRYALNQEKRREIDDERKVRQDRLQQVNERQRQKDDGLA